MQQRAQSGFQCVCRASFASLKSAHAVAPAHGILDGAAACHRFGICHQLCKRNRGGSSASKRYAGLLPHSTAIARAIRRLELRPNTAGWVNDDGWAADGHAATLLVGLGAVRTTLSEACLELHNYSKENRYKLNTNKKKYSKVARQVQISQTWSKSDRGLIWYVLRFDQQHFRLTTIRVNQPKHNYSIFLKWLLYEDHWMKTTQRLPRLFHWQFCLRSLLASHCVYATCAVVYANSYTTSYSRSSSSSKCDWE